MPVFFISSSSIQGDRLTIDGPLFDHLRKSLRINHGQNLVVGDTERRRYQARVRKISKRALECEIIQIQDGPPPTPTQLTLGQAILKGNHMSWALQKATELGVSAICPLITERVVAHLRPNRYHDLQGRWQRIAIDASQQSERWDYPHVEIPSPLPTFIRMNDSTSVGYVLVERTKAPRLGSLPLPNPLPKNIMVLVGPEGGWTEEERELANQANFTEISLGEAVFRAETAPLVALTLIQHQLGALG